MKTFIPVLLVKISLLSVFTSVSNAAIVRESNFNFLVDSTKLMGGYVQTAYRLLPQGSSDRTRLLEIKSALHLNKSDTQVFNPLFWSFSQLAKMGSINDVQYVPLNNGEVVKISYPVRQPTFGLFPKRTECEIKQMLYKKGTPEFTRISIELKDQLDPKKGADIVVVQKCTNFNMMFETSESVLFFTSIGENKILVQTFGRFQVLLSAIAKIQSIPFINAESTIGHGLVVEIELFRNAAEK